MPRVRLPLILLAFGYLAALMLVQTLVLAAVGDHDYRITGYIDVLVELAREPVWWLYQFIIALIMLVTQALFLLPVRSPKPPRAARGRSLFFTLISGAFVGGIVVIVGLLGLSELIAILAFDTTNVMENPVCVSLAGLLLVVNWLLWGCALVVFVRDRWSDTAVGRVVGVLIGGTAIEWIVILPIDAMVRRRTDCYCNTGSFLTLLFGGAALVWLSGPMAYIALTRRRRKAFRATRCERCGYPKGPSPGEQCPECGRMWASVTEKGG